MHLVKKTALVTIIIINAIIAFGFSTTPLAEKKSRKFLADDNIVLRYHKLFNEEKYDEAYELIGNSKYNNNQTIKRIKANLLITGELSTGKDLCKAVLLLEDVYQNANWILGSLNYLYKGNWSAIAAKEGHAKALFNVGNKIHFSMKSTPISLLYDDTLALKKAYQYYYNAELLGNEEAGEWVSIIVKRYPDIDFKKFEVKMKFDKVYCPVRQPK